MKKKEDRRAVLGAGLGLLSIKKKSEVTKDFKHILCVLQGINSNLCDSVTCRNLFASH